MFWAASAPRTVRNRSRSAVPDVTAPLVPATAVPTGSTADSIYISTVRKMHTWITAPPLAISDRALTLLHRERHIKWFASAWDMEALEFLRQYDLPYNKIASVMLVNIEFLEAAALGILSLERHITLDRTMYGSD